MCYWHPNAPRTINKYGQQPVANARSTICHTAQKWKRENATRAGWDICTIECRKQNQLWWYLIRFLRIFRQQQQQTDIHTFAWYLLHYCTRPISNQPYRKCIFYCDFCHRFFIVILLDIGLVCIWVCVCFFPSLSFRHIHTKQMKCVTKRFTHIQMLQ